MHRLIATGCFVLLLTRLLLPAPAAAAEADLRVRVAAPAGPFQVEGVVRGKAGTHRIAPDGGWLTLDGAKKRHDRIRVDPPGGGFVRVNGRRYRGRLELLPRAGGATVVNLVPLESYLKGVLPAEIGGSAPLEAQKAQAVVARSFTIATRGKHAKDGYDLCDATCCQVYKGRDAETASASRAVDETRGIILRHGGAPFPPFYHASCGGRTATPEEAWAGGRPHPALKSVRCPVCAKSPVAWSHAVDAGTLARKLTGAGYRLKQIERIEVLHESDSGRIDALMLIGRGESVIVSGFALRRILGETAVKSTRFGVALSRAEGGRSHGEAEGSGAADAIGRVIGGTIDRIIGTAVRRSDAGGGAKVVFTGRGYGHGVGLCQRGAIGMAEAGRGHREILSVYFPGARLVK